MKLKLSIDYYTGWGQTVCVYGSIPELGNWDENAAIEMVNLSPSKWTLEIDINDVAKMDYHYLIKTQGNVIYREWGTPHFLYLDASKEFDVTDLWKNVPLQKFLYTSGFSDSFFVHKETDKLKYNKNTILLKANCPYVKKNQTLVLSGSSPILGDWEEKDALHFDSEGYGEWHLIINASQIKDKQEYKLGIYDNESQKIIHWELGSNRILSPISTGSKGGFVKVESLYYYYGLMDWKAAGVSIPVFSLRSNDSFGIGEFSDLKKLIDWAEATEQKIIQVLPINDTTITYTWIDSYPYNAISIYALHPIYLGLKDYPLKDNKLYKKFEKEAKELNVLKDIDYDGVLKLKLEYVRELFKESGKAILKSKDYQTFYEKNEEWLFPYACFSYLRDKYKSADYSSWKAHKVFDRKKLQRFVNGNDEIKDEINLACFVQYLLHKQLVGVKEYAHQHSVILKGDIPIGVSRHSVEAWMEPHLFNLDVQTGAPPDDFSFFGQNWGFPTYNWDEMAKDGYQWWVKRFRKMADYFDAYRIDHILGFFRIWEIPLSSVQGLLGYFSPALPLSVDEIRNSGMWFDEYRMTSPYIHEHFLSSIFGIFTQEVIDKFLQPIAWQRYELKEEFNTQMKIKNFFEDSKDDKAKHIRDGLYSLCNEVLFIRDKNNPDKFHPRITAQYSYSYKDLDGSAKDAFNRLYDDFFYRRHSKFWRDEAMKKLPTLISSTSMLVCGEDLGMVPECVPSVMQELQILSLEIERMPKERNILFSNLSTLPYLSVCTTSTHDMSPIRLWWKEDHKTIQQYYNQVLWKQGEAPEECSSDICWQILTNHLNSPAMLAVLPLQDWLSMDDKLKRPNEEEERINIPAVSTHYWRYRMHITLEDLLHATDFNSKMKKMIDTSGRV